MFFLFMTKVIISFPYFAQIKCNSPSIKDHPSSQSFTVSNCYKGTLRMSQIVLQDSYQMSTIQLKSSWNLWTSPYVKFLLNQRRGDKFDIASFLRSRYISNQSGSAKETVSQKIDENIEILVCLICMGSQDRALIDIKHHYQITMNRHKNWI